MGWGDRDGAVFLNYSKGDRGSLGPQGDLTPRITRIRNPFAPSHINLTAMPETMDCNEFSGVVKRIKHAIIANSQLKKTAQVSCERGWAELLEVFTKGVP